ncbi:MAG: T9SS type A sorting domain-containing protein [Bacteroidia bacterium]|nr:T9SS type A sorting domain-containing protein [Bacteroidia bacterium]
MKNIIIDEKCKSPELYFITKLPVEISKKANQPMQENQTSLNIYPNPTNGTVWIKGFSEAKSVLDLTLIDILGRKVFDASTFDANKPIDLNQIAPGIYYLLVKGSGIDQKFMLIKE